MVGAAEPRHQIEDQVGSLCCRKRVKISVAMKKKSPSGAYTGVPEAFFPKGKSGLFNRGRKMLQVPGKIVVLADATPTCPSTKLLRRSRLRRERLPHCHPRRSPLDDSLHAGRDVVDVLDDHSGTRTLQWVQPTGFGAMGMGHPRLSRPLRTQPTLPS